MKKAILLFIASILLLFGFNGCGTIRTVSSISIDSPMVYSGTRLDYHALVGNRNRIKTKFNVKPPRYPAADMPFSIMLDTVVFPLTSSVALYEIVFH